MPDRRMAGENRVAEGVHQRGQPDQDREMVELLAEMDHPGSTHHHDRPGTGT